MARRNRSIGRKPGDTQSGLWWQAGDMNDMSYIQYYNKLTELSVSMFEWVNLPDSMDARYLELALFYDGHAVVFKDEVMGMLGLRCMMTGTWDVYKVPEQRRAFAANGYTNELNPENSVIVWNNFLRTNSLLDVQLFATRLANIDRTIDVNTRAQKTPVLIQCDESQRLTLRNLYAMYDGNTPFIFGDKSLNRDSMKALRTDAPFLGEDLYQLKTRIWNEAMTYLGISAVNVVKKERLLADEVTRNEGGMIASRYSRLEMRRSACRQINKMFGTDIWCNYRQDFRTAADEPVDDDTLGGTNTSENMGNPSRDAGGAKDGEVHD